MAQQHRNISQGNVSQKKSSEGCKDIDSLHISDHTCQILYLLGKPFEILFSLLLLFSYYSMVVTLFPVSLILVFAFMCKVHVFY